LEAQGYFKVMKQRSNTLPPLASGAVGEDFDDQAGIGNVLSSAFVAIVTGDADIDLKHVMGSAQRILKRQ
jgi:hypothetical protein